VSNVLRGATFRLPVVACLLMTTFASAEPILSAKRLLDMYRDANAAQRQQLQLLAATFERGVGVANAFNKNEGRPAAVLYCSPGQIALQGDQLLNILQREIEDHPYLGEHGWEVVMVTALRNLFPCKP
jgi:hypothetical protein